MIYMIFTCRCINGSTLLHTAAYFGGVPAIKDLMRLGLDIDLLDYKGATALHRARDVETILVSIYYLTSIISVELPLIVIVYLS